MHSFRALVEARTKKDVLWKWGGGGDTEQKAFEDLKSLYSTTKCMFYYRKEWDTDASLEGLALSDEPKQSRETVHSLLHV